MKKVHPSYGLIKVSRCQGGKVNFFGSETSPNYYISIEISQASVENDTGRDWYMDILPSIISVDMTFTQFAELISSPNIGVGVPCTISRLNGKLIEQEKKTENKLDFYKSKIATLNKELTDKIFPALNTIEEKFIEKLPRKDHEIIKSFKRQVRQELDKNIQFLVEEMHSDLTSIAQDIRLNAEADLVHKINQLGLQTLETKLLNED